METTAETLASHIPQKAENCGQFVKALKTLLPTKLGNRQDKDLRLRITRLHTWTADLRSHLALHSLEYILYALPLAVNDPAVVLFPAPDAVVAHAWELAQLLQDRSPTMKAVVNACYQCLRDSMHQDCTLTTAVSTALSVAVSASDQIFALLKAVWQVYCCDVQRVDTLSQLTLSLTQALGVAPAGLKDIAPTIANIIANYLPLKYHAPATAAYLHALVTEKIVSMVKACGHSQLTPAHMPPQPTPDGFLAWLQAVQDLVADVAKQTAEEVQAAALEVRIACAAVPQTPSSTKEPQSSQQGSGKGAKKGSGGGGSGSDAPGKG